MPAEYQTGYRGKSDAYTQAYTQTCKEDTRKAARRTHAAPPSRPGARQVLAPNRKDTVHRQRRVLKQHVLDSEVLERLPHLVLRHPAQPVNTVSGVEVDLPLHVTRLRES
jgi:hypothetical protein